MMTLEDKKKVYDTLSKEQKKELKELLEYFEQFMWLIEPSKELFGVEWYQGELSQLVK